MGGSHCAIPGCNTSASSAKRKGIKRKTLFSVLRPEFAKTPEVKKHREALQEFLISLRNDDDEDIKMMLHKESAMICERHFVGSDIIRSTNLKHLRVGALPSLFLPKEVAPTGPMKKAVDEQQYDKLKREGLGLCCRIPGCNQEVYRTFKVTKVWYKYTNFKVKDPTFMKTDHPQYDWYKKMKDFLIQFPTKDSILDQYHRDCVYICERHFASTDLIYSQGNRGQTRKKLREGAMPALNLPDMPLVLPDKNRVTRSGKPKAKSVPSKPVTVSHRTFASLVASARKFSHEKWKLTIGKDLIRCSKQGDGRMDQDEFSVEITNEFKIGIVYCGWGVPINHFATGFDMRKNNFDALAEYIESMRACDGFEVDSHLELKDEDDVAKHSVTHSSGAFSNEPITVKVLTHRSRKCDVLLKKPSFGSCIACTTAKSEMKKQAEKEEKLLNTVYTTAPEITETDSFSTRRMKNILKKKMQECDNLALHVARKPEFLSRQEAKWSKQEEMARKFIAKKALTFDEYMKPILKYKETNELPDFFETFWRYQIEAVWMHTEQKPVVNALRYPEELMRFFGEMHLYGKGAYNHLLRSKVLVMPGRATIKKFSEKLKGERERAMDNIICRVACGKNEPMEETTIEQIIYETDPADQYQDTLSDSDGEEAFHSFHASQVWGSLEDRSKQMRDMIYRQKKTKRKFFYLEEPTDTVVEGQPEAKEARVIEVLRIPSEMPSGVKKEAPEVTVEVDLFPTSESEESGTDEDQSEEEAYEMQVPVGQKEPVRIDNLEWILQSENAADAPE